MCAVASMDKASTVIQVVCVEQLPVIGKLLFVKVI